MVVFPLCEVIFTKYTPLDKFEIFTWFVVASFTCCPNSLYITAFSKTSSFKSIVKVLVVGFGVIEIISLKISSLIDNELSHPIGAVEIMKLSIYLSCATGEPAFQ